MPIATIDPRTGETQVHAELADPRWVEPVPGTPAHLPDGRVLIGGELAHDGYDLLAEQSASDGHRSIERRDAHLLQRTGPGRRRRGSFGPRHSDHL